MIKSKTKDEIEIMREGGQKLLQIKEELAKNVTLGKSGEDIDKLARELIAKAGGKPSFKMVKNYFWTTCVNINDGVVHGIPDKKAFKEGDIVSIDVGFFYKGFHTDTSFTTSIGKAAKETLKFLDAGKKSLKESVCQVKPGRKISAISKKIQKILEERGYSPVRALTGHGIGRELHEEPNIPCFWDPRLKDEIIPEGAVFAIEVIYTLGLPDLVLSTDDNWTISTKDGKIAGLFEETVAASKNGPQILTA